MSPRTRNALRQRLLDALGNKCSRCPQTDYLQFDCKKPMGSKHHKMFSDNRLKFYLTQLEAGNLQLLCPKCHTFKTMQDMNILRGYRIRLAADCKPKGPNSNT